MSIFRFIKWLLQDKPLEVFGNGHQKRDFTYIDDIVEGTIKALKPVGYEIINLGSNTPYELQEMIKIIEKLAHKRAVCEYQPFPQADIKETWANIDKAKRILNWQPKVHFEEGLQKTIEWFQKNWSWVKKIEG
jgi:nucleoside-diphosphate-sugar epimerase